MQVTLRLFGAEVLFLDLTDSQTDEQQACDYTSQPIGFVARMEIPEAVECPNRE